MPAARRAVAVSGTRTRGVPRARLDAEMQRGPQRCARVRRVTHRVSIRCNNCRHPLTLRIVVAGGHQPFVFACPHCAAPLHGTFVARLEPMELRADSDDFEVLRTEDPDQLAVAVATDVPVHLGLVGVTGEASMISPFILASQDLGLGRAEPVIGRAHELRTLREQLFPGVRRAASFWADRDLQGLTRALEACPGSDRFDWENETPMALFDDLVSALFEPLEQPGVREASAEELLKYIGSALDSHFDAFDALFGTFDDGPLEEHRRRVVSAVFAALKDVDAFFPALWAEAMEGHVDLAAYRVMRDDFAQRKSSYQDLFELTSRTLAFTAPIANLVVRNDHKIYCDNQSRTPHKALKARAIDREGWLADFPLAKPRFESVSRHTRNNIGHALVRQDVRQGILTYDDGAEQNYMHFLVDWLQVVRLSRYALDVIVILDYTRSALRERSQA